MLLLVAVAGGTSADSGSVAEKPRGEAATYEVAAPIIITREIDRQEVVREVAPDEVVVKETVPQYFVKRRSARRDVAARPPVTRASASVTGEEIAGLEAFLDRLMMAESGGRDTAANPRSTAIGPFQFIKATFIDVARRNFPRAVAELSDEQLLELRTSRSFARAAAAAYTGENAALLKAQGLTASLPNLRLAFLLGATGAVRVLQASPQQRLSDVLGASVLRANPFMVGMTATGLIARATREVLGRDHVADPATGEPGAVVRPHAQVRPEARPRPGSQAVPAKAPAAAPALKVSCNRKLTPCRRWIALQKQKQEQQKQKTRDAQQSTGKGKKRV